ncbi:MAG: thioredoxin family protein [Archaeoglobaceae archaeon]
MLSQSEEEKAREILNKIKNPVDVTIIKNSHDFTASLEGFAKKIRALNNKININTTSLGSSSRPGIRIGDNIVYHALPTEMELEPFLNTLTRLSEGDAELDDEIAHKIEHIEDRVEIIVFVMPVCPHCAKVVERVNQFAIQNNNIQVYVIDVAQFQEMGSDYKVTSAPTVVINQKIKLLSPSTEELLEWIEKRDDELEYFGKLLQEGEMDGLKETIAEDLDKTKMLVDLLKKEEINIRIGAVILITSLMEDHPEKLEAVKTRVKELLTENNTNIVQDAALVLGRIGDRSDIEELKALISSDDEEIRDAAEEAIEEINSKEGT